MERSTLAIMYDIGPHIAEKSVGYHGPGEITRKYELQVLHNTSLELEALRLERRIRAELGMVALRVGHKELSSTTNINAFLEELARKYRATVKSCDGYSGYMEFSGHSRSNGRKLLEEQDFEID